ncbi:unnamed protein product [Cuscuta europaea]|uniref:Uncharacterized protein n=1 Tax=Cuscuta europaea TaxID=41803 RepID=A0A9P0Z6Q8_CUSEU|nr:unnamed protein product [Cuscuta europaea]
MASSRRDGYGGQVSRGVGHGRDSLASSSLAKKLQSATEAPHVSGALMKRPAQSLGTHQASSGNNETISQGSNVRGKTCSQGARKAMKSAKTRLTVEFDFDLLKTICANAEAFNNEIGYIVRTQ